MLEQLVDIQFLIFNLNSNLQQHSYYDLDVKNDFIQSAICKRYCTALFHEIHIIFSLYIIHCTFRLEIFGSLLTDKNSYSMLITLDHIYFWRFSF